MSYLRLHFEVDEKYRVATLMNGESIIELARIEYHEWNFVQGRGGRWRVTIAQCWVRRNCYSWCDIPLDLRLGLCPLW